jgi:hypothetical protein
MLFNINDFNDIIFSVYIFNNFSAENAKEKLSKLIDVYISKNSIIENKSILYTYGMFYTETETKEYYAYNASLTLHHQLLDNLIIMVENYYKK